MLLNDTKIRATKPKSKEYRLRDGDGLFLVIRSNGKKYWQLRYQFLNKEKSISLGRYPQISLSEARIKKNEHHKTLEQGKDPSTERKRNRIEAIVRNRNDFYTVAEEWYSINRGKWVKKYACDTWSRLQNHLFPSIGGIPISELEPLDVLDALRTIEIRGTTDISHRALQICAAIFDYAVITGRVKYNITTGLSKALKPHRKAHHPALSVSQIPEFFEELRALNTSDQNKLAMKILMHTAIRTGELRFSKWSSVNFENQEWRISADITKMKTEHIVPMSNQVITLFKSLYEITGDSEWILPSQNRQTNPVMSENTINHMIHRMGFKGKVVGHGFRSMFSTITNEFGFNRDAIERQLAHMERNKVRAAYNRAEYLGDRRKIMHWWSDFLDTKEGINPSGKTPGLPMPKQETISPTLYRTSYSVSW